MTLLLDENLSRRLAIQLADVYPGSTQVVLAGSESADDPDVWAFARANGYVIVTKDDDFRQRSLLLGHPPKVVWLRLGNCPTTRIESLLRWNVTQLAEFERDADASLLILP